MVQPSDTDPRGVSADRAERASPTLTADSIRADRGRSANQRSILFRFLTLSPRRSPRRGRFRNQIIDLTRARAANRIGPRTTSPRGVLVDGNSGRNVSFSGRPSRPESTLSQANEDGHSSPIRRLHSEATPGRTACLPAKPVVDSTRLPFRFARFRRGRRQSLAGGGRRT